MKYSKRTSDALFSFLAHGSEDHRAWLKEAIEAFRLGLPRPEQKN